MRHRVAATVVVAALVLLGPASHAIDVEAERSAPVQRSQVLTWTPCGDGECAALTVPLDYKHPSNGKSAEVTLYRVPARDAARRIGSLVMNPGGPGASGVEFVRNVYSQLPDELKERFDIVGFDPRGAGGTLPVDCGDVIDEVFALDYAPDTEEERAALLGGTKAVVEKCRQANRGVLKFISSASTARDLERIRAALGDQKLTFLGYSYGTYLGALYADRHPKRVRALVLDGGVDPELSAHETALQQTVGFEESLSAFLEFCSNDQSCELGDGGDAGAAFDRLAAEIDAAPIAAADGRTLGPGIFVIGVLNALYEGEVAYRQLGGALAAAANDDAVPMLALADDYTRRNDEANRNVLEAFWAIGCRDGARLAEPEGFAALEPEFRAAAPRLGASLLYLGLMCAQWPLDPVKSEVPLRAKGAPPILVIGTVGDPATPPQWAAGLADELDSGVLLEAQGGRHTSFVFGQIPCVDEYGVRYLVDLVVPPTGATCSA